MTARPYTLYASHNIKPEEMGKYWPGVLDHLEKYVRKFPSHCDLTILLAGISKGSLQLWFVVDNATNAVAMAVITEVKKVETTGHGMVSIYALAGEQLPQMAHFVHDIGSWARKHHNITEIELTGRPGIERVLKPMGFKREAVIMRLDLDHG